MAQSWGEKVNWAYSIPVGEDLNEQAGQRSLTISISLAHAVVHCIELTYAALLLRIGVQFGVDKLALGFIANAFALAFGVGALPSGVLVDRLGSPRVLRVCFLTAAGAALLVALLALAGDAGSVPDDPRPLHRAVPPGGDVADRPGSGATRAGAGLPRHGREHRGRTGAGNRPRVRGDGGWRWSYVFLAGLALAMVVFLQIIRLPTAPAVRQRASAAVTAAMQKTAKVSIAALVLIYMAYLLNGFIYRGSMTFMPTLIEEQVHIHILGIDETALAGSLTTLALLTGGAGQYLGGSLSDRGSLERLATLMALALLPALLLMGMSGGLLLVGAAAVFVFFNFAGQPVYNILLANYVPGTALGRSYGLSFFASFGLGSTAASFSGLLADRWGTSSVFLALAVFGAAVLALAGMLWRLSSQRPLPGGAAGGTIDRTWEAPG